MKYASRGNRGLKRVVGESYEMHCRFAGRCAVDQRCTIWSQSRDFKGSYTGLGWLIGFLTASAKHFFTAKPVPIL